MAKFNTASTKTINSNKTVNHEGEVAYTVSPELELYMLACTSIFKDKFYTKAESEFKRIQDLVPKCRPEFVAKLAVYVREKMYLRSMPIVLTNHLANKHNGDKLVSKTINRVVKRADEITEMLAYYQVINAKKDAVKKLAPLSKQVQKGLAYVFNKFDEYAFAKYNRKNEVKFRDALFLVHPKAKDANQQEIFDKIVNDTLKTADTWEAKISDAGQKAKDKTADEKKQIKTKAWEDQIESWIDYEEVDGEIKIKYVRNYMALIRNICNLLKNNVDRKYLEIASKGIAYKPAVLGSKQLPFRFYSAFKMICQEQRRDGYFWGRSIHSVDKDILANPYTHLFEDALDDAIIHSIDNIPFMSKDECILIANDTSGSMSMGLTDTIAMHEIGTLLGVISRKLVQDSTFVGFDSNLSVINVNKKKANILHTVSDICSKFQGGATYGHLVLDFALSKVDTVKYDKIFMFTDMQMYGERNVQSLWKKYKALVPNCRLYIFDLAGHGQSPLDIRSQEGVYIISGWSDKIFDVLASIEKGSSIIDEIMKIEL